MISVLAWLSLLAQKSARASANAPCKGNKAKAILREFYRKTIWWKYTDIPSGLLRLPQSNGITEGFSKKMEMISLRVYDIRNFNNFRVRVLALCGWNGVINRI